MTEIASSLARVGKLGSLIAVMLFLAGCSEEPQPVEPSDAGAGANQAARTSTEQEPVVDSVPEKPPVQSEPETTAGATPRPVTPEELQSTVAQSQGKLVLVDFWATWCAPCIAQFPHTVELSKKHATDLVVLSVAMNDPEIELADVSKVYAEHDSGNVQPLISAGGGSEEAFLAFDITNGQLPHYKLYGRDGKLIQAFGGDVENPVSSDDIDKAIAAAMGEK